MAKIDAWEWLKSSEFTLIPLTEETIEVREIPEDHLLFLKVDDNHLGPFYLDDFKNYLKYHSNFPYLVQVKLQHETDWVQIYDHHHFTRRKQAPSTEVPPIPQEAVEYFLLVNGQKKGPFDIDDIRLALEKKEILMTDSVSINQGQNWLKIAQLPTFDRRNGNKDLITGKLPLTPKEIDFTPQTSRDTHNSEATKQQNAKDEAIVTLAILGHVKAGNMNAKNSLQKNKSEKELKEEMQKAAEEVAKAPFPMSARYLAIGGTLALALLMWNFGGQLKDYSPFAKKLGDKQEALEETKDMGEAKRIPAEKSKRNAVKSSPFKRKNANRFIPPPRETDNINENVVEEKSDRRHQEPRKKQKRKKKKRRLSRDRDQFSNVELEDEELNDQYDEFAEEEMPEEDPFQDEYADDYGNNNDEFIDERTEEAEFDLDDRFPASRIKKLRDRENTLDENDGDYDGYYEEPQEDILEEDLDY